MGGGAAWGVRKMKDFYIFDAKKPAFLSQLSS
jgi:hypothetical protein